MISVEIGLKPSILLNGSLLWKRVYNGFQLSDFYSVLVKLELELLVQKKTYYNNNTFSDTPRGIRDDIYKTDSTALHNAISTLWRLTNVDKEDEGGT